MLHTENTNEFQPLGTRSHEEMKDVLMHPDEAGPKVHYYMIRGGSKNRNVTVWVSGTVGEEFVKTYGHYHVDDIPETYEILMGTGVLLMQMRKLDDNKKPINDEIEWVRAVLVKQGDKVYIPPRAGHLMVNTGETWLVASDDSPVAMNSTEKAAWPEHADYSAVKSQHGFAYFILKDPSSDIGVKFVKNSNYKEIPPIVIESANTIANI